MEYEILEKLSNVHDFSDDFINLLNAILRDIHHDAWNPYLNKITVFLITFCCQSKYTHLIKSSRQVPLSATQGNKKYHEYCLDLILQLLLKIVKFKKGMAQKITDLFFDHYDSHHQCLGSIIILYKLIFFSDHYLDFLVKNNYISYFIELFERNALEMLKEFESEERFEALNATLNAAFSAPSFDFHTNLNKLLHSSNNNLNQTYNPGINPNFSTLAENNFLNFSDFKAIINEYDLAFEKELMKDNPQQTSKEGGNSKYQEESNPQLAINRQNSNSNIGSNINCSHIHNYFSNSEQNSLIYSKTMKIPILQIPPNNVTENFAVSRSTRRADPHRSFSTNSNRFSNMGSNSVDGKNGTGGAGKNGMTGLKEGSNADCNMSLLDAENSYAFDDVPLHFASEVNPRERMKELASQLGEYCLTVDLGCLLIQKRKNQLDQVAKMAVFQEVDSLMNLKIDEKLIKEKISRKKKHRVQKRFQKTSTTNKDVLAEVDKPQFIHGHDTKDFNGSVEGLSLNSSKSHENMIGITSLRKRKAKPELKNYIKICKILSNVIYMILKDYEIEDLNYILSPVNIIYMYLSSKLNSKIRQKELLKHSYSKRGWSTFYDHSFELDKINMLCEGIDNRDDINRHYEKTIFEQYKAQKLSSPDKGGNIRNIFKYSENVRASYPEKGTKATRLVEQQDLTNLHFSTTFDNTNNSSSMLGGLNESMDSIDMLNLNERIIHLESILLPESVVCFKILDIFSVLSEKTHEQLAKRAEHVLEGDENLDNSISSLKLEKRKQILIRGVPLETNEESAMRNVKKNANSFLCKFQKKFMWLLNNLDMNKQIFYEIECEQLEILERFLSSTSSRIITFETMDYILEFLFMLKRQFLELSLNFPNSASNTTRLNTPKVSAKSTKTSSSAMMVNNVLKPLLKVSGMRPESPNKQEFHPNSSTGQHTAHQQQFSKETVFPTIPFILKEKDAFGLFLSIIATILMKIKKTEVHHLLFKLFVCNENWNEVVRLYVTGVFSKLFAAIEDGETRNLEVYSDETAKLFINCQKILSYFKAICIAMQSVVSKEKLIEGWESGSKSSSNNKDESKREWRESIRRIFQNLIYLIKPNVGVLDQYLTINKSLFAALISNSNDDFPKKFFIRFNLFKEVYQCITMLFSFDSSLSCLLQEDIACYYLRFSYISFVKLYSFSSNSELNEINSKINDLNNRMKKDHNLSTEQIDEIYLKKEEKQKPEDSCKKKSSMGEGFKIELLKLFVRCLFALSKSRTVEISQKFYQYRILEFFTREVDLEYEITQIRERFLRVRNEAKKKVLEEDLEGKKNKYGSLEQKLIKKSEFKAQFNPPDNLERKSKVPALNLNQKKGESTTEINGKKPLKALLLGGCFGVQDSNRSDSQTLLGEGNHEMNKNITAHSRLMSGDVNPNFLPKKMEYTSEERDAVKKFMVKFPNKTVNQDISGSTSFEYNRSYIYNESQKRVLDNRIANILGGKRAIFIPRLDLGRSSDIGNVKLNQVPGDEPIDKQLSIINSRRNTEKKIGNPGRDIGEQSEHSIQEEYVGRGGHVLSNSRSFMDNQRRDHVENSVNSSSRVLVPEGARPKKKAIIPILKIPAYKPQTLESEEQNVKYKGSHGEIEEDVKNEEIEFVPQAQNIAKKMIKIPSLKIGEVDRHKKEEQLRNEFEQQKYHYQNQENSEATEGNLTKLEKSLNKSNPKMQLLLESSKIKGKQIASELKESPSFNGPNLEELLTENIFYYSERKLRKIYEDEELHSLIISLMISLLLTPKRGVLDELYCSQYPINDGKPNILYLLHFHLNHPSNQHILPLLLSLVSEIPPYSSGQRLLKLLCISLSELSFFSDWKKIATGAYGTIFECNTNLAEPSRVAIKQLSFPKSIYDRCVLHDIFTEITCLENFRLEPCITDIYDYGVTENEYVIVMKKYPFSLKEWRLQQKEKWQDNLPLYLTIYRDVLRGVQMLHNNSITHYDIKSDNILLDFKNGQSNNKWVGETDLTMTLADFGECKMFTNEEDEYCLRNRGTEYIKSPEMLTLTINAKKEGDKYDRRKKIGTTRASDIWSLGCLLYEILTGEFLFYDNDWVHFYIRVTSPNEVLLTNDKLKTINHNIYLVDFLKYILVKEPQHRPNIDNVLKRFEHIHALLVSNTPFSQAWAKSPSQLSRVPLSFSIEETLELYERMIREGGKLSQQERVMRPVKLKHCPTFMKITEEVYICRQSYFLTNYERLISRGITHIITKKSSIEQRYLKRFRYQLLDVDDTDKYPSAYQIAPEIMDFLREVFLYRGNVLFIEDDVISVNSREEKMLQRNIIMFFLTYFFKVSVYEAWTLVNCQLLFLILPMNSLVLMSNAMQKLFQIEQYINTFPKVQCICGCSTIVLKRNFNVEKNISFFNCKCTKRATSIELSDCPSDGCQEYLNFIKTRYKLSWENLKWGFFDPDDFVIGPNENTGQVRDKNVLGKVLNSEGAWQNAVLYERNQKQGKMMYSTLPPSKLNSNWSLFKCRVCGMWMYALSKGGMKVALVMNNTIKRGREGILSIRNSKEEQAISTPVLKNFNLYELR